MCCAHARKVCGHGRSLRNLDLLRVNALRGRTGADKNREVLPIMRDYDVGGLQVRLRVALAQVFAASFASAMAIFAQVSPTQGRPVPTSYMPTLTFDVTSVRQCPPGPHSNGFVNPPRSGRLTGTGLWASQLIGWAYGVDYRTQIVGGPDWVKMTLSNEVRFDVEATSDSATEAKLAELTDSQAKLEEQHMLQALLQDRFRLKAHLETRDEPAFALTVSKGSPKLERGDPMGPKPANAAPGTWHAPIGSHHDPRGIEIVAHGASIGDLVEMLGFYAHKSVIDRTGIIGTYNFALQFHGTLSDMEPDDESEWLPLETAIREQLGLQLKNTMAPLQVVVIDHIEMPTPN
jgi:uncharacterized protein (TIGR03435 family)